MSPDGTRCKHFEICQLLAPNLHQGEYFCLLHLPAEQKDAIPFLNLIAEHLAAGRSDFRYVYFPETYGAQFTERVFPGEANLMHIVASRGIFLDRATLPHGLRITGGPFHDIRFDDATIEGSVDIQFSGNLEGLTAYRGKFRGDISIQGPQFRSVNFTNAETAGRVTFRGGFIGDCTFYGMKIQGSLDCRDCHFSRSPDFRTVEFGTSAEVHLSGSVIEGKGLTIVGVPIPPAVIALDGTTIQGDTRVEAESGRPSTRLLARKKPPRFGGSVRFTNVDLSECRLVGNYIPQIEELGNIRWARRFGRSVLYDEIAMRRGARIGFTEIREAYQVLKEKYRVLGDNARAGDFHYGEMEMRRRERGWLRRFLSPEFLYWFASGYGTGYVRAFLMMVLLILLFAGLYWWTDCTAFPGGVLDALRYSIGVATLQRPQPTSELTQAGRWVQLTETILGPVQIALFALALRMRLKR